jgi:hypothetical protein
MARVESDNPQLHTALLALFSLFSLFTTFTLAVTPVKVEGADFVNAVTGSRFQIIGVEYAFPTIFAFISLSNTATLAISPAVHLASTQVPALTL